MSEFQIPLHAIKGRGAATRIPHRFLRDARDAFDDGWAGPGEGPDAAAPQATHVVLETARSAICANDSPDIFFEHSVNPYRGCEHGCIFIAGF